MDCRHGHSFSSLITPFFSNHHCHYCRSRSRTASSKFGTYVGEVQCKPSRGEVSGNDKWVVGECRTAKLVVTLAREKGEGERKDGGVAMLPKNKIKIFGI